MAQKVSNARSEDGERRRDDVVNMHIDVQVNIESGACTLRTSPKEQNVLTKRPSAKDLRAKNIIAPPLNYTKFSIPRFLSFRAIKQNEFSVDLKGYYVSGTGYQSPGSTSHSTQLNSNGSSSGSDRTHHHLHYTVKDTVGLNS